MGRGTEVSAAASAGGALETHTFRLGSEQAFVTGRYAVCDSPADQFRVLPPAHGCGSGLSTVAASVAAAAGECEVAVNAGFFNTSSGACLGALVTNGAVVEQPATNNAAFGLRDDGQLVTGHVAASDEGGFQQLVSGVVWLVRGGEVYVDESWAESDQGVQETGDDFVTVKSARTAIGHDADGRLLLAQVDGKTGVQGADLYELAALMVELGAQNAVNLDGGGSATWLANGSVANAPSDDCAWDWQQAHGALDAADDPLSGVAWANTTCARPVTSVVCLSGLGSGKSGSRFGVDGVAIMIFVGIAAFVAGVVIAAMAVAPNRMAGSGSGSAPAGDKDEQEGLLEMTGSAASSVSGEDSGEESAGDLEDVDL